LPQILKDGWEEIDESKARPTDIVVWYDDNKEMSHSAWLNSTFTDGKLGHFSLIPTAKRGVADRNPFGD